MYVTEKPGNLMPYLTARGSTGHWVDVKYLLKLCLGANLSEEAVYLYTILGMLGISAHSTVKLASLEAERHRIHSAGYRADAHN